MKIHELEQGTPEWLALRAQYPTASEFGRLLTPAQLKPSKQMGDYVARKLAEKWLGGPLQTFQSAAMDQGAAREESARNWYALEIEADVETVGFITNDADTAGCSPDALVVGQQRGAEIKCPEPDTLVSWLLAGGLPPEHRLQVQGSMLVTGFAEWDFMAYHPPLPTLRLTVPRDPDICAALEEALGIYWDLFRKGWARLVDANGGEEPTRQYDVGFDEEGGRVETLRSPHGPTIGQILRGEA